MGRVRHFEIHASDTEVARRFYGELLGWGFERYGEHDYWVAKTGEGDGIDGAIMGRRGPAPETGAPVMGATVTAYVDDLDATLAKGVELGGAPAGEKIAIPGYGWAGYLRDPDNNVLGLFQPDPAAG